jgi:outer membrane lipoprotein-sorting protein
MQLLRGPGLLTVSFVLLLSLLLGGWADDWASIRKAAGNVRSLRADFVQTKRLRILKRPIVSRGSFFYRRPAQMRWEYSSPVKSVVIMDADGVQRYAWRGNKYVRDATAKLRPVQAVLGEMSLWLRGDFAQSKVFSPSLRSGSPPRVRLVPRDPAFRKLISQIELLLSRVPGVVDAIEIVEGPDASTRIEFVNLQLNQPLADRVFKTAQ